MNCFKTFLLLVGVGLLILRPAPAVAQRHIPSAVEIAFDRYHTHEEITTYLHDIAAAYPELVELRSLGRSLQGRDLWLTIVNAPATGPHTAKPAMWIDGAVHANEIQSAEAVLYTLWQLTKSYGRNAALTELLDTYSFYLLPMVNPDSRVVWFERPSTPNSSRGNQRPVDSDDDGLFDEDGPDDLDGDGHITAMWRADEHGRWIRDQLDPRVFRRAPLDKRGSWTYLGDEGIDNDGDGRINEDGLGGDDMNRNWPSDWQPTYVQGGAGPYPFSAPETRAIGRFILDHPNIAGVQSYHNAGGMILRGPGAAYRESFYPNDDRRVYDEIAATGEQMLPYYRSMVIHKDLYTVHGGFVNWTAEGLGIFSFTNELWNPGKYFQREVNDPSEEQDWLWRDRMAFGELFTDYTEHEHPEYGTILVGGLNKWSNRNTPTFMLQEECHRNFAFTMYHAGQMPRVRFGRVEVAELGGDEGGAGVWSITVEVRNDALMPTRSGAQRQSRSGTNDLMICETPAGHEEGEEGLVITSGILESWTDRRMDERQFEPGRVQLEGGVPGRAGVIFRFLVTGQAGDRVMLRFESEKAKDITHEVVLGPAPNP